LLWLLTVMLFSAPCFQIAQVIVQSIEALLQPLAIALDSVGDILQRALPSASTASPAWRSSARR
jgi:hypothetical protein